MRPHFGHVDYERLILRTVPNTERVAPGSPWWRKCLASVLSVVDRSSGEVPRRATSSANKHSIQFGPST